MGISWSTVPEAKQHALIQFGLFPFRVLGSGHVRTLGIKNVIVISAVQVRGALIYRML